MVMDQQPFDILAETYDEDFSYSLIGKIQRERVWNVLLPLINSFDKPLNILELNCGTGIDAIRLAKMGHNVIATDASSVMIERAANKLQQSDKQYNIQFIQACFEELEQKFGEQKFDLVFSNFGGLNCIDTNALKELSSALARRTHKNSYLFFVLMSSRCLWEMLYHTFRFKFKTAFRRWKKKASFTVKNITMPIYYYSPKKFGKIFGTLFKDKDVEPVGLFVPPSYMESYFVKHPTLLHKLNSIDNRLNKFSFTSNFADHYCIVLKRNIDR